MKTSRPVYIVMSLAMSLTAMLLASLFMQFIYNKGKMILWCDISVNLADLLFSVSEAMDLYEPSLVNHQVRTAYVADQMARTAKIENGLHERLFIAALLHDMGALSPEEKVGIHRFEYANHEEHCTRGGQLFREANWLAPSADLVELHHAPMSRHLSRGLTISDPTVLGAQFLLLADTLERAIDRNTFILLQANSLRKYIQELSGDLIHPDVVALFTEVSKKEGFWLELVSHGLAHHLRRRSLLRSIELDFETARSISYVFKSMVDFRSSFTASHAGGVSTCALGIGRVLAFSGKDLQQLELAGLLHDIGKLVVPDSILLKPGKLTPDEYAVIRQHPYYTFRILSQVKGFELIAEWAAFHHERLDGSGYFGGLRRGELDLGAKIVAVADVATAIMEHRPYRGPKDSKTILDSLDEMVKDGLLEPVAVEALADNFDQIIGHTRSVQSDDDQLFLQRYSKGRK